MTELNNTVFLAMGTNLGDRIQNLKKCLNYFDNNGLLNVQKVASLYETTPYGDVKQNNFYNTVVKAKTGYSAKELFTEIKRVEKELGRTETERWGPRIIDIDILFYNDLIYSDEVLTIPHKDLHNRDFVVKPLIEIAPDFVHPILKKRLDEIELQEELFTIIKVINNRILIDAETVRS